MVFKSLLQHAVRVGSIDRLIMIFWGWIVFMGIKSIIETIYMLKRLTVLQFVVSLFNRLEKKQYHDRRRYDHFIHNMVQM